MATTISSSSPMNSTPSGAEMLSRVRVSAMPSPDTSTVMESGMSVGRASTMISRVTWLSTPPSLTPGASSEPSSSSTTSDWIFWSRRTRSRSRWRTKERTSSRCWSLMITGWRSPLISMSNSAWPSVSTERRWRASTLNVAESFPPPYTTPGT